MAWGRGLEPLIAWGRGLDPLMACGVAWNWAEAVSVEAKRTRIAARDSMDFFTMILLEARLRPARRLAQPSGPRYHFVISGAICSALRTVASAFENTQCEPMIVFHARCT